MTSRFYAWELRGRGWSVYDDLVDLEPPFRPFYHVPPRQYIDDGRVPSLFDRIFPKKQKPVPVQAEKEAHDEPYLFPEDEPLRSIELHFNRDHKLQMSHVEQFLLMIASTEYPISFELFGMAHAIKMQFVCRLCDAAYLAGQLHIFFPLMSFVEQKDVQSVLQDNRHTSLHDFGLTEEFMRPLHCPKSFDPDPLTGIMGILEGLQGSDGGGIQLLFKGTGNAWAESTFRSVVLFSGESFFVDAPEMVPLVKDKIGSPFYTVVLRTFGQSSEKDKAQYISQSLGHALKQATRSPYNSLVSLQGNYSFEQRLEDVINRTSHRLGMLINSKELVNMLHPLSPALVSSKVTDDSKTTKAVPAIAQGHDLVLGYNLHGGIKTTVSVSEEHRLRHMHVIGATGTGKSSLLINGILQDIHSNKGVCVLDPHGDLIDTILPYIPDHRLKDVILVDPSDTQFTIGLNLLSAHSDTEKELIASDLVSVFRKLSTSWGDQMNSVFANAILAFLESSKGGSLHDLKRFLVEKDFRTDFLKTVQDDHCLYYWTKEYPLLKSTSIGPILTRLDTFLRPKSIRNMVTQQKGLDFENILNSGKILLVKLSQGLIGVDNSYLLGTLFVSKIHQAAMARQSQRKEDRNNFYCYIDEFHNFITPSMAPMLSGVRKYALGLILAHQDMQQLHREDAEIESSLMANAGIRVCFRVSEADAKRFENSFASFDAFDLQNQDIGEAIIRIERPQLDCNIKTYLLPKLDQDEAETRRNTVIALSNETYGVPISQTASPVVEIAEELIVEQPKVVFEEIILPKKEPIETQLTDDKVEAYKIKETKRKAESEHRYLQTLIKKMAEARGYKALLEEPTPDGKGRVDVALEKDGKKIACEISMTTTDEWEVHNIIKCLEAGYEMVVVCSTHPQQLKKIKIIAEERLDQKLIQKVQFFLPEELFGWMDKQTSPTDIVEQKIKGYRIKVNYKNSSIDTKLNSKK